MVGASLLCAWLVVGDNPRTLDCRHPVPPQDYAGDRVIAFEQATATGAPSTPADALRKQAREALLQRLCTLDSASCAPLAAQVKDWAMGSAPGVVCAQAVVSVDAIARWRAEMAPSSFDGELRGLATRLAATTKAVVIRGVEDGGTRGGARAAWLVNRMQAALSGAGVTIVEPPATWNGARPVKPAERLVRAELVDRVDPVRQLPVVEVLWKSSPDGVVWQAEPPFVFPAAMAPPAPRRTAAVVDRGDGVVVHVDARSDGSLCSGDRTQVFVSKRTPQALHARVLNIDSAGHVLVLFPSDQRPDDALPAGATITLGDDPFEIAGVPGDRERYVVVAAADRAGLGRLGRITNARQPACRLSDAEASRWARSEAFDAPLVADTGFTVVDDGACRQRPRPFDPAEVARAVAQLPVCP
jgi:hypothetical protein